MTNPAPDERNKGAHESPKTANVERIMELLPHRYPMLMIDRVENILLGASATGIKNVTFNEPHFQGHFPGHPVMPGVLIVEAMGQTAGVLVMETLGQNRSNEIVYFTTIDKTRFRRPVVPGDSLRIEVKVQRNRGPLWRFLGEAYVAGQLVAEAEYSAMIVNPSANGSIDGQ